MQDSNKDFHTHVAEELVARYATAEPALPGWLEVLTWHYEQAGLRSAAAETGLRVAEEYTTRLDFREGQRRVERALELLNSVDDAQRQPLELRGCVLAVAVLDFAGQYAEALNYARRWQQLAERRADLALQGRAALACGRMLRELGQFEAAAQAFEQASEAADRAGLSELEFDIRLHLARLDHLRGRHLAALQQLDALLEDEQRRDDRARLARVYTGLGDLYRVLGAPREALLYYQRARRAEEPIATPRGLATVHDKLSLALLELGRLDEAVAEQQQSLSLRSMTGDTIGQARSHSTLGTIALRRGNAALAVQHFERMQVLEEQTQNRRGMQIALANLGQAERLRGGFERAEDYLRRALDLARADRDQIGIARVAARLGDLYFERNNLHAARLCWNDALQIRDRLRHADEAFELREKLARV